MKKALVALLVLTAIAMIVIGISGKIMPPILTGVGFIIISILFYQKE